MKRFMIAAMFMASTPATAAPTIRTPSGQPEAVFKGMALVDAGGKVASACMDLGWTVLNQTSNQVVCESPMNNVFQQALATMLVGNSYSTPAKRIISVSLAQVGDDVRAQSRSYLESQMAMGQVRQEPMNNDETIDGLLNFLTRAGADLPLGTVFTGVFAGFENTRESGNTSGMVVNKVYSNSSAARGGLQVGDQIVAINGKGYKNQADFLKKLQKVKTDTYTLEVRRKGAAATLTLQRAVRPAVGTAEYVALMEEARRK